MILFTAVVTLTVVGGGGYVMSNMQDRFTGTQGRDHENRPYHEGAGQRLAVIESEFKHYRERTDMRLKALEGKFENLNTF